MACTRCSPHTVAGSGTGVVGRLDPYYIHSFEWQTVAVLEGWVDTGKRCYSAYKSEKVEEGVEVQKALPAFDSEPWMIHQRINETHNYYL